MLRFLDFNLCRSVSISTAFAFISFAGLAQVQHDNLTSRAVGEGKEPQLYELSWVEHISEVKQIAPGTKPEILSEFEKAYIAIESPDTIRRTMGYGADGAYITREVLNPYNGHKDWERPPLAITTTNSFGITTRDVNGTIIEEAPLFEAVDALAHLEHGWSTGEGYDFGTLAETLDLSDIPETKFVGSSSGGGLADGIDFTWTTDPNSLIAAYTAYATPAKQQVVAHSVYQLMDASELSGTANSALEARYINTTQDTLPSGLIVTRVRTRERTQYRYHIGKEKSCDGIQGAIGVYPNPLTGDQVTIALPVGQIFPLSISVTDASGRLIASQVIDEIRTSVFPFQLPPDVSVGLYLITVSSANGTTAHKIAVQPQ